jgi:hypothetical protein
MTRNYKDAEKRLSREDHHFFLRALPDKFVTSRDIAVILSREGALMKVLENRRKRAPLL